MILRKAILIIHGFGGGTYDEEFLAHRLELVKNFDVYTFTLAGHDGLFRPNMKETEWIKSAEDMIKFLLENEYKSIYVIGHSMGGVIASYLASKYKEIKKVVLLAAAFRYLEFKNDNVDVFKSLKMTPAIAKDYGKDEVITRLLKMPISSLKEFSNLVKNNENTLKNINVPILIIQGNKDKLVPLTTADFIYNRVPSKNKEVLILDGVTHDIFRSERKEEITYEIIEFLKKNYGKKIYN